MGSVPLAFERLAEYLEMHDTIRLVERMKSEYETEQYVHPADVVYAAVLMMALLQLETKYDFATIARKASLGQTISSIHVGQKLASFIELALPRGAPAQRKVMAATDEIAVGDFGPFMYAAVTLLWQYERDRGRGLAAAARLIRESMRGKEAASAIDLRAEKFLS